MPINNETLNRKLFRLLSRYKPQPLDSKGKVTPIEDEADVFKFTFTKDGESYGNVFATIDDNHSLTVYYGDDVTESPSEKTPGLDYDDTWTGLMQQLKYWAMKNQLSWKLQDRNHLENDMARRDHMNKKDKVAESYYPMGKKGSYSDAIPTVKIVIEHSRAIEEGEQRYRNINRIFLENQAGERILAPTTKPGVARVYGRLIAEGDKPYSDRWNHITSIVEEYNQMGAFVRATRNNQFNESAQQLVNEGINHYQSLRETLSRMTGHRGYNAYFESWTPALLEDEGDDTNLNELFVQETLDPRIESVMPILSRLHKKVSESAIDKEVSALSEWADTVLGEEESLTSNNPVGIPEAAQPQLSVQQLAAISDEALDNAYHYGRSTPGNTFGWQANLMSAAYAKKMIDAGVTDIDKISDAIHNGWNVTAQKFVQNPDQFDDTAKLQAAGKLEAKVQQRAQLMKQNYAQLPEDEKEKDRVVARALLQAIRGDQDVEEGLTGAGIGAALGGALGSVVPGLGTAAGAALGGYAGHKIQQQGISDKKDVKESVYPDAEVIKSRNGKPIGEIYQDEYGWGCLHYKADNGADGMSNREEALEQLKDMHNERRQQGMAEAIGPDVMRHQGDKTIKIVKRAGKTIGEIGIDAEASPGNGSYYVKMYDGSYDAAGFETAEEALAELKDIIKQTMSEDLDANQKRVGQLGPTEKVKNNNIGKLVGANENFINQVDQAVISEEDEIAEGLLNAIKKIGKKVADKVAPGDEELLSKLEKETGGKRPNMYNKDDKEEVSESNEELARILTIMNHRR